MLEEIRRFLQHTPFQPFVIHTRGGEVLSVEHPENASVIGHYVTVLLPDGEQAIMLSALHLTGVSGLPAVEV